MNENAVASKAALDPPLGASGPTEPEFGVGAPAHVPLRNQSTLTLPVGGGFPATPLTVTRSWTVVPTGTAVTTVCPALWIAVLVIESSCWTVVSDAAPPFGGFGLQFVFPVAAGSLQASCHVRSAVSVS